MIDKNTQKQLVRFALVGILSSAINYGVFYLLYSYLHQNYILSTAIGFISGVLAGFLLNKTWTFSENSAAEKYIVQYFMVYLFSLGASLLFMKIAVEYFTVDARLANFLSIGFTTVLNFLGTKLLVFKK
jgi:putative flippase GtrA